MIRRQLRPQGTVAQLRREAPGDVDGRIGIADLHRQDLSSPVFSHYAVRRGCREMRVSSLVNVF